MTKLYPLDDAAEILSVSKRTLQRMIADRQIIFIWVRKGKRITEEEINRYIAEREKLARIGTICH